MKVVFVVGPTASGKSQLALSWAQETGGAIVNCDSIQVYQGLNIGSAKPSSEEFQKVPHFLFDYVKLGKEITAGEFAREFFATLEKIKNQFPVIFVVGGTGFYFQAIEKGMYTIGAASPETLKKVEAEIQENPQKVYQELQEKDPAAAAKISINDHYRLARAIEMMRTHGLSVTEIRKEFESSQAPFPYPLLKIGIQGPKEALLPRVQLRTRKMLQSGLLEEVKSLCSQGLSSWAPLQSVGYKETLDYLSGQINSLEELESLITQNTMRLAKKQRTWFRRDPDIHWIAPSEQERGSELIQDFIRS